MSYERMDEPIEMIVHFASKKVIPLRFFGATCHTRFKLFAVVG